MKLDELSQPQTLSLDLTPLIDIVFLLVLFFAVSTSFISPEQLEELKNSLASLMQEKKSLENNLYGTRNELTQYKTDKQLLQSTTQAQTNKIVIMSDQLKQLQKDLASLNHQNHSQSQLIRNQNNDINQYQTKRTEANQVIQAQTTSITQLNERVGGLVNAYGDLSKASELKITELQQLIASLNTNNEQHQNTIKSKDQALSASQATLSERNQMLSQQAQTLAQLNQKIEALVSQYQSLKKTTDDDQEKLTLALLQANNKITAFDEQSRDHVIMIGQLTKQTQEIQSKYQLANSSLALLQDTNQALAENVSNLTDEVEQLELDNKKYKQFVDQNKAELAVINHAKAVLDSGLKQYLKENQLGITQSQGRLIIHLSDKILFDSGSPDIKQEGLSVLEKVGALLKSKLGGFEVQIGGHTDDIPIKRYKKGILSSNWGLSAARSVNVVRFFDETMGLPASQMSAAGYSQYRPVADNATAAGRSLNRRIEITVLPKGK